LETFWLNCHPDTPARTVRSLKVSFERRGRLVWLRYDLRCRLACLRLPVAAWPSRQDGLWLHTCFEAFVGADAYAEFNFSPSGEWAAYAFSGYRQDMRELAVENSPEIVLDAVRGRFTQEVVFAPGDVFGPLGLCAVIEEMDGTKSYWALAHPPGKPDFHAPTCFAAMLAAPTSA
jgi:hypothetical protein